MTITDTVVFDGEPFAVHVTYPKDRGPAYVLWGWRARYNPDTNVLAVNDGATWHDLYLEGTPEVVEPGHVIAATQAGTNIDVRKIRPTDAMLAAGLEQGFPLPIEVLEGMAAMTISEQTTLQAVVDENGWVVTLILITDIGMYARYDNNWQRVTDPAAFLDDFAVYDATPDAVAAWDAVDVVGDTMAVTALPLAEGQNPPEARVPEPDEPAVTAAGQVLLERQVLLRPIRTRADIPDAITAAMENESARWYVERRIKALGVEDEFDLPWRAR